MNTEVYDPDSDLRDLTVEYKAVSLKALVMHIPDVPSVVKNSDGCQSPSSGRGWLVICLLSPWAGGEPIIHFLHFGGSGLWPLSLCRSDD